ncbi:hypothetical protein [Pseudoflavonifractor phocaeensis]|uniref:hypothetical protein n=1 Tax=Pseudoflavonifractor phocaeensis TaxID=1870988 RepID=UPI00195742CB|nr:hypothetical protein [Pseudoflavonifractor phocaeensis]MBM6723832.1 hypothetical protein [Pseudoflavonifractor phocaeensis]
MAQLYTIGWAASDPRHGTSVNQAPYHEALCIISEYVETELPALQDQSKGKKEKHAYER